MCYGHSLAGTRNAMARMEMAVLVYMVVDVSVVEGEWNKGEDPASREIEMWAAGSIAPFRDRFLYAVCTMFEYSNGLAHKVRYYQEVPT